MDGLVECEHSEQMTALMSLRLDGLLEDPDRHRLDRHLASCTACRSEWEGMQRISALFERSDMIGPPLGFAVRVERQLEAQTKKRRQLFGGLALVTSSLSLAGVTVAVVLMLVLGIIAWNRFDSSPAMEQGTHTVSQVASGMGLVGKGASLFLSDLLLRYGAPLVLLLVIGLMVLIAVWAWLLVKRPGGTRHNGYT
jgi:predicted anti-sigma-YlaC factor YlaD